MYTSRDKVTRIRTRSTIILIAADEVEPILNEQEGKRLLCFWFV